MNSINFVIFALCLLSFSNVDVLAKSDIIEDWHKACKKVGKIKIFKLVQIFCEIATLELRYEEKKGKYRFVKQIERGKCANVQILPDGRTEVCSSNGARLYWKKSGSVRSYGCYNFGQGGSTSFTECCQFWSEVGGRPIDITHKFCSGPVEKGMEPPIGEGWLEKPRLLKNLIEKGKLDDDEDEDDDD